jgi:tetratricopeptide (TPR) repeat protein
MRSYGEQIRQILPGLKENLVDQMEKQGPSALSAIGERHPSSVGIDPALHVSLMENHDEAFYIWRDAGVKQRVLMHVDAHHDMRWIQDQGNITIADFICPALEQGLVGEVFWVVPDATFESARSRKPVLKHLSGILRDYPAASRSPVIEDHRITASVLGKNLTVCPLRSLPTLRESVLLDIDVDYMVIPRVSYGNRDQHALLPWRWPSELVERLRGIRSDLITVVYSVEGGYTPLQWKYLGDELVLRLKKPMSRDSDVQGMDRMREGAEAELRGETAQSESKYRQAMDLLPGSAAPSYRLARHLVRLGRLEEGRRFYQQAVALDGSYKGAYSSAGFHRYWREQFEAAGQEFRDIQVLDPDDVYAHLGLGLLATRGKRWGEAEQHLRAALTGDPCLVDAQHVLGDVLVKLGRNQEALTVYERALKLGLMGHKPLSGPILTHVQKNRLLDPWHCHAHIRLAALYERNGAATKAVNALRISIAGGLNSVAIRLRLARLYAKQRQWRKSAGETWQAVQAVPKGVQMGYRRLHRQLTGKFRGMIGK